MLPRKPFKILNEWRGLQKSKFRSGAWEKRRNKYKETLDKRVANAIEEIKKKQLLTSADKTGGMTFSMHHHHAHIGPISGSDKVLTHKRKPQHTRKDRQIQIRNMPNGDESGPEHLGSAENHDDKVPEDDGESDQEAEPNHVEGPQEKEVVGQLPRNSTGRLASKASQPKKRPANIARKPHYTSFW